MNRQGECMARAKGSQTPGYKAAKKVQDSEPNYIEKILKYSPKAMDILFYHIDNPSENMNLSFGAAKKVLEERNRLYKELKDKLPKDYIVEPSTKNKEIKGTKKEDGNNLITLEYVPDDEAAEG